jgi:hypothetical protein
MTGLFKRDVNDHSNFRARVDGNPKNTCSTFSPSVSKEVEVIQMASICEDDQFPLQTEMKRLLSGGFVQVQDLNAGMAGKGTCVNFWSPVSVKILGKNNYTFTLRNRLIDQGIVTSGTGVLHWMRGPNFQERLSLTAFSWSKKTNESGDIVTQWSSYNHADFRSDAPVDGTYASLNMQRSWAMDLTMRSESRAILEDLPYQGGCANLTRFAKGHFLPAQDEYSNLDMLAIVQLKNQKMKVGIICDAFEYPATA